MATPGKFVTLTARTLGIPEATAVLHDRYLVEAGYRTKGARGVNAPHVTERDAAHLLTAILASGEVKDTVATIERYEATRPARFSGRPANYKKCGIKELARLAPDHSFLEGVEALFAAVANGSLPDSAVVEVAALTPGTIGDIRIAGLKNRPSVHVHYDEPFPWDQAKNPPERQISAWEEKRKKQAEAGLETYRRVLAPTIFKLGQVLKRNDGGE